MSIYITVHTYIVCNIKICLYYSKLIIINFDFDQHLETSRPVKALTPFFDDPKRRCLKELRWTLEKNAGAGRGDACPREWLIPLTQIFSKGLTIRNNTTIVE